MQKRMGTVKTCVKIICSNRVREKLLKTKETILVYCILMAIYYADGLKIDNLTMSPEGGTCSMTAKCEISFSTKDETTGIKQSWLLNGKPAEKDNVQSTLNWNGGPYYFTRDCDVSNFGNLTCVAALMDDSDNIVLKADRTIEFIFSVPPKIKPMEGAVRANVSESATLHCTATGYPAPDIQWVFEEKIIRAQNNSKMKVDYTNHGTSASSTLMLKNVLRSDNGTYMCEASSSNGQARSTTVLYVQSKPEVVIVLALGVNNDSIYLNWTLKNGNLPVLRYHVKYMENGTGSWLFSSNPPNISFTSHLITGLKADKDYQVQLEAENALGRSNSFKYDGIVRTLSSRADYKPSVELKGSTSNSFTLGWTAPPEKIRHLIGHFVAAYTESSSVQKKTHYENMTYSEGTSQPIRLFTNLKPATMYFFQVKACHRYIDVCGEYSDPVNGTTIDGKPSEPRNVQIFCHSPHEHGIDSKYSVYVTWETPAEPNGQLAHYRVSLEGTARYRDDRRQEEEFSYGPMVQTVDSQKFSVRFDDIPPNTNYTVSIRADTRTQSGLTAHASCRMPWTLPDRDSLSNISMSRYQKSETVWGLRVHFPRVSERKGPVCCYSVIVVKMLKNQSIDSLAAPQLLPFYTYDEVHRLQAGAYIAKLYDAHSVPDTVVIGDESVFDASRLPCRSCSGLFVSSEASTSSSSINVSLLTKDGQLSPDSNYTAFIKVYGPSHDSGEIISVVSPYAPPLTPKPSPAMYPSDNQSVVLVVALGILCGLALVLTIIVAVLFVLRRYSKHVAQAEGVEMSLGSSCRHLWRRFRDGRHLLVSVSSASASPIPKHEIMQAFIERHQNADYGFQHEYEMLPERFADRTTRASDSRENMSKNRYPDIKAYDQTRVKLNLLNGDPNSDYINANFVMGYKERKKFICAQGPMESTVHDFWRMAWEQRVEIIVMLTNIEEYNKTKCFQYWPDPDPCVDIPTPEPLYVDPVSETQSNGGLSHSSPSNGSAREIQQSAPAKNQREKVFGDIRVLHVKERRFSEYVVRELQVSRPKANTPTDPEMGVLEREVRPVFQYHYLVWKDFQAPEHATGILRFLRRLNEDYSTDRGPILIHCSAGVGRTGTLVAIDHLIQQVEDEGCVSVFNTVCDLRHQRNFLVQSLRQYIFVYRTLMEWVQFGNTEMSTANFQESLKSLKHKVDGHPKSLLEEEFDKLSVLIDDRKPLSVASSEENRAKNRNQVALPFDRNRVILTPVPGRDYSTYINASFVEGYDNSESFIVTQDPLEATVRDFWRMILEHNVAVIIMLSEVGEEPSACLTYWPDEEQEVTHDHIVVKHVSTSTMPAYIQREFLVKSTRHREEVRTTQLQFLSWNVDPNVPAAEDDSVPTQQQLGCFVSMALETLVARGRPRASQLQSGPACVHCSIGSIRSSVFLAVCILIEQARTEGFVDIFSVVRKLRSQRSLMVQHLSHYTFIYDAMAYYLRTHPASLPSTP